MFYSYKNLPIKIDGYDIFAKDVNISYQASLEPRYQTNQRHSFSYAPTNGIQGTLKLSYYLTGADYIKTFILSDTGILSGNFGGLYFNSGYLANYSINAAPNTPVLINSDIKFFEDLKGAFNPQFPSSNTGYNILNYSDITVSELNGYSTETVGNILSCNFNYSTEVNPVYTTKTGNITTDITPDRVFLGRKEINTEIVCDNLNPNVLVTGKNLGIRITFNHPNISNLTESFTCSGVLSQKSIKSSVNDLVYTTLSIIQNNVDEEPSITGFDPLISSPANFFRISGRNLSNITSLYFADRPALRYTVINDNLISGIVPYDSITGKIQINTYGGMAQSSSNFNLTYPTITINSVFPYTGSSGQSILISGNNFYRISHVFIGSESGNFKTINSGIIQAYIPPYAQSGKVLVVSVDRGTIFAISSNGYVPTPYITGFGPNTGFYGSTITLSGFGFSGLSKVQFNGINATSFIVNTTRLMTAVLPTGNVRGYIYLEGTSGVNTYSQSKFNPSIIISGTDPLSGLANDLIRISGRNFQSGLMYNSGDGFRIKYNDVYGIVDFSSETLLTGRLPSNFTTGPIYIFQNDGVSVYSNTGYLKQMFNTPTITTFSPQLAYSGIRYDGYIQGTNLFNITGIMFSGTETYNTGRRFIITNTDIKSDILGLRLNIINYTGFLNKGPGNGGVVDGIGITGLFQLKIMSNQYPLTSLSTSTAKLTVKVESQP